MGRSGPHADVGGVPWKEYPCKQESRARATGSGLKVLPGSALQTMLTAYTALRREFCRPLGESLTYDDLLCYSGFAFRISVNDSMCPSAGHPCCGYVCLDNGFRALPWELKSYESPPGQNPKEDRCGFEAEVCAAIIVLRLWNSMGAIHGRRGHVCQRCWFLLPTVQRNSKP